MQLARAAALIAATLAASDMACAVDAPGVADLVAFAAHVTRTPKQPWPGYGVYLGAGLVLTASHVAGSFAHMKPHVVLGGQDFPTSLVREGSLDGVDLTLLSFDPAELPMRLRLRRMTLCEKDPYPGEAVVVATPEGVARSRVLSPASIPPQWRARFGNSMIPDVATTGNSGSGVFDAWKQCLLGVMSRKFTIELRGRPPRKCRHREILRPREGHQGVHPEGRVILGRDEFLGYRLFGVASRGSAPAELRCENCR